MEDRLKQYYERVGRLGQAQGEHVPDAYAIDENGNVIRAPRKRRRFRFPYRGVIGGMVLVVLVKGYLLWYLGDAYVEAMVDALMQGEPYERLFSYMLTPDPISNLLVQGFEKLAPLLEN